MTEDTKTTFFNLNAYNLTDFQKKIAVLTFVGGPQIGRRVLLAHDTITIGRSHEATILVGDSTVSRIHVEIGYAPGTGGYQVRDRGSSNGTLVNDRKVSSAMIREGDKIIIGQTVLRFSWHDAIDLAFHGEVDKLINIDELTGLVLKRRFDEEFQRHVAVSQANGTPLSLIMMDMDGLKRLNDTHGHAFGAHSISETGRIIKTVIGSKGLASRFGGDEFMAFLPAIIVARAADIAEEIRREVEQNPFLLDNVPFRMTISIGLAGFVAGDTCETLFKRADAALYRSKNAGRNRVSVEES
jgi:diguanylate cyclase (GGDEF)-like protein